MPLFDELQLFNDRTRRDGPAQMAVDEALLENAAQPVLRVYSWAEAWASFGYSQSEKVVAEDWAGWKLVRRWTGGGVVAHEGDWTFALVIPRGHAAARLRPSESYRELHVAMAAALKECGIGSVMAGSVPAARVEACFFHGTVCHDLLNDAGVKICGGAQRRTMRGVLHQGSLQGVTVPGDFGRRLAGALAGEVRDFTLAGSVLRRAEELAAQKYGSSEWTKRLS